MFWKNVSAGRDIDLTNAYDTQMEGSPLDRAVLSLLLLCGIYLLRNKKEAILRYIRTNYWLLFLVLFGAISIIWSDFPLITLKRCIRCLGTYLMMIVIVTNKDSLQTAIKVIEKLSLVFILGSLCFIVFVPSLGTTTINNELCWIGITVHKNVLSKFAVISILIFFWRFFRSDDGKVKLFSLFMCITSAITLIGAKSFNAILLVCIGITVMSVLEVIKRVGKFGVGLIICMGISLFLGAVLVNNIVSSKSFVSYLFEAGGKDQTLTGRTDIWDQILKIGPSNTWLGSGYSAFWLSKRADLIRIRCNWEFYNAHNGFLDMYLQCGIFGVILLILFLLSSVQNVKYFYAKDFNIGKLWVTFLIVALADNLAESNFFYFSSPLWFILTIISAKIPFLETPGKTAYNVYR